LVVEAAAVAVAMVSQVELVVGKMVVVDLVIPVLVELLKQGEVQVETVEVLVVYGVEVVLAVVEHVTPVAAAVVGTAEAVLDPIMALVVGAEAVVDQGILLLHPMPHHL
jgi:hypothetical protein